MTTRIKTTFLLLCLSLWMVSCAALRPVAHPAHCLPDFPDRDGWYGGDGAYSILLDDRRTLWLFGDTFVSEDNGRKDRIGMDVVLGNTLAVSTCSDDQKFSIRYFIKKHNGKFTSFFGPDKWLWPQDPFIANRALYVPLLQIQALSETPQPFNFTIAGHWIARIRNYASHDPNQWVVEYLDWTNALPEGVEALAPTSVVHSGYVYFYPLYRYKKGDFSISGNILARIPTEKLDHPGGSFEYLHRDGAWLKEPSPENIKIIFSAGLSELSVRYHAPDRRWTAVYLSPENKGDKLIFQTAPDLEGPWSVPAPLAASVSEIDPESALYDPNTFCYAGKEHRQFSQNHQLVVTYVCNSSEDLNLPAGFLRKNLFLYRPTVKRLAYPSTGIK